MFSAGVFIWTQLSMLFYPGWGWSSFRSYYAPDQLANFAMVVNGSRGNFAAVEPFTETGTNNDPHLYFVVLGAISHFAHLAPAEVYNLGGVGLQIIFVICLSLGGAALTQRWWAAYLGALPYLIGTLSFSGGGWYTLMQSHAVLWGPFGSMFALNSASAALAIAGTLFLCMLAVVTRSSNARLLTAVGIVVGAGVGLLANIDTYGFITALFFGLYGLAAYAMAIRRRWWPAALTLGLLVLVFVVGQPIASSVGRLAVLLVGLVPALPGIVMAVSQWRARVVAPLLAATATAAPQIVGVWSALRAGNAFLKMREASSANLGVSWEAGFVCALPVLVALGLILLAGVHRRRPLWIAYPAGAAVAWFLVAKNDLWGANQEPYQLWVDGFALTAFTIVPLVVDVALAYLPSRVARRDGVSPRWRVIVASLLVVTIGVAAASSIDWYRFYRSQENQTISLSTPADLALKAVVSRVDDRELVMPDPCVNPELLKAVTGARVVFYSLGLAWPARVTQINEVTDSIASGGLTHSELWAAGIGWMVTAGACPYDWARQYSGLFTQAATSRYGPSPADSITLWRLRTTGPGKSAIAS